MTTLLLALLINKIYLHNVYQLNKMTDTLGNVSSHHAILLECAHCNGVKADTQASKAASKDVTIVSP